MSTMKSVRWMFVPKHTHAHICTAHQHMHTIQHHRYGNKRRAFYIHAHPIKWPSSLNSRAPMCVCGKHTQIKWEKKHTELWIVHGFSHIHEVMCCHRGINFFHSVLWVRVCVCDLGFFSYNFWDTSDLLWLFSFQCFTFLIHPLGSMALCLFISTHSNNNKQMCNQN